MIRVTSPLPSSYFSRCPNSFLMNLSRIASFTITSVFTHNLFSRIDSNAITTHHKKLINRLPKHYFSTKPSDKAFGYNSVLTLKSWEVAKGSSLRYLDCEHSLNNIDTAPLDSKTIA